MQNSFFMQQAINEALKADSNKVYPNPLVGCVIVKNDKIIGRGHHKAALNMDRPSDSSHLAKSQAFHQLQLQV